MESLPSLPPANIDRRRHYLVLWWTLSAFTVVFVALRLAIRIFIRKNIGWDDYLIVPALLSNIIMVAFYTIATQHGILLHEYYLEPQQLIEAMKWTKAAEVMIMVVPVLIKVSVLFSILRLVSRVHRNVTIFIWVIMALMIADGLASFFVEVFECVPIKKKWDPSTPGHCLSHHAAHWVYAIYGLICTITDFACAIIPTFVIHKLQMDRKAKIALCCVLGLAIFPGICSIFKIIEVFGLENPDYSWAISGVALWAGLETTTGLIIACLPMLWTPCLHIARTLSPRLSNWKKMYQSWRTDRSSQRPLRSNEFAHLDKSEPKPIYSPSFGNHTSQGRSDTSFAAGQIVHQSSIEEALRLLAEAHRILRHAAPQAYESNVNGRLDLEAGEVRASQRDGTFLSLDYPLSQEGATTS